MDEVIAGGGEIEERRTRPSIKISDPRSNTPGDHDVTHRLKT